MLAQVEGGVDQEDAGPPPLVRDDTQRSSRALRHNSSTLLPPLVADEKGEGETNPGITAHHEDAKSDRKKKWQEWKSRLHFWKDWKFWRGEEDILMMQHFPDNFANNPSCFTCKAFEAICVPVFFPAVVILIVFVAFCSSRPDLAVKAFPAALTWVNTYFGWFYIVTSFVLLVCIAYIYFSKLADIRLGDDDEEPEFSTVAWFAMLFSAGMGVGLVFFGVAEPVLFYVKPPLAEWGSKSHKALVMAVPLAIFHWGLHGWAPYLILGLSIAYFSFRMKLPISIRSCFYPVLGKYIYKWPGDLVDLMSVFGTIFGLATSLGLGAKNISAGMQEVFHMKDSFWIEFGIISVVTVMAIISLITGVEKGIKFLSLANLFLAGFLTVLVLIMGPTRYVIDGFVENVGNYIIVFFTRWLRVGAYDDQEKTWMMSWTLFYLGWWFSWAPFVGLFIARVSRGRTIREFILGVLFVPTLLSAGWFTVYGSMSIYLDASKANGAISDAALANSAVAIYEMLKYIPGTTFTSIVAMLVILIFFVTSSDSGSFVVDLLASGGHPAPPTWQRIFWAISESLVALTLLYSGGTSALEALQSCVVCIALPMCILFYMLLAGLIRALHTDPAIISDDHYDDRQGFLRKDNSAAVRTDAGTLLSDLTFRNRELSNCEMSGVLRNRGAILLDTPAA